MIPGVQGRLITASFALTELPLMPGVGDPDERAVRELERWSGRREMSFGPASSLRAVTDGSIVPLLAILGFSAGRRTDGLDTIVLELQSPGSPRIPAVVVTWNESLQSTWRTAVLHAIRLDARWAFCFNGTLLRIVDARRTWARHYLEFDLGLLADEPDARALLWRLARAQAFAASPPVLDRAVELCDRQGNEICRDLSRGVLGALDRLLEGFTTACKRAASTALVEQSLTVLYRVLFLLFAEARGLVPVWHPVYRDRYTIDSIVSALLAGQRYRGIWPAIRAISRMAHAGCTAGTLRVTAFNGRLFAPSGTDAFEPDGVDDSVMRRVVLALSTTSPSTGRARRRIAYHELDVEQLGAVYERILGRDTQGYRKSTGAFYTPRSLTALLVRETLRPLVTDRSADDVLALRVLDPAMGSGAFLVEACIQLAEAVEDALVREGRWHTGDVTPRDRAMVRREVTQRCLFGVDLNPTAVQIARLALWLTTLAADRPLTFLDHHLVCGNSLIGATLSDVQRRPPGGRGSPSRARPAPLFDEEDVLPGLRRAVDTRLALARQADDSAAVVHAKEQALAVLHGPDAPLGRWRRLLDLWCSSWFDERSRVIDRALFGELTSVLLHGHSALAERTTKPFLESANTSAVNNAFFHWPIAFPEVFTDGEGRPREQPGFDAVIGNPPWDMIRGDTGDSRTREGHRRVAANLTGFVRESGVYRLEARAHINSYQLFVERALQLTRPRGRIGLVLPGGVLTDSGSAPLRRLLFQRAKIDRVVGFHNRRGIFPVHRSVRFSLLTCTAGEPTDKLHCQFGLDQVPQADDMEGVQTPEIIPITRSLLSKLSGEDDLAVPEVRSPKDLQILESLGARVPTLRSPHGWHVAFGRELNATDHRHHFEPFEPGAPGRPVLEGKHIEPFHASTGGCRYRIRRDAELGVPRRARLAYREIASATNRLTLIAAIIPADAVTTHTLFCLRTALGLEDQHVLCALLNSFVANYLVRFRVNTHVTAALISRLRVPRPESGDSLFARLASLAKALIRTPSPLSASEYPRMQALAARAYGLSVDDFRHVLTTFPLIPGEVKMSCLTRFIERE